MKQPIDHTTLRIRRETPADHQAVETLTRNAFYNLYVPGCMEHYLVHIMRQHEDFLPELAFVLERGQEIIGNVMYTKAQLVDDQGTQREVLTFGPVCIAPAYQRCGYGKQLLEHSFVQAAALGHQVIVIFGNPGNYVSRGFRSCKRFNVSLEGGAFPAAMLVKELTPGTLDGRHWTYHDSPVMQLDEQAAQRFDDSLETLEKKILPCQEEFYIHSHAMLP